MLLLIARPGLEATRLNPGEELRAAREGPSAHVAMVQRDDSRFIRVNSFCTLGSSAAPVPERNQTMIPPRSIPIRSRRSGAP